MTAGYRAEVATLRVRYERVSEGYIEIEMQSSMVSSVHVSSSPASSQCTVLCLILPPVPRLPPTLLFPPAISRPGT